MDSMTYGTALKFHGITIPPHLEEDLEVPVLTGLQAQGDLLVAPVEDLNESGLVFEVIPNAGIQVVQGEGSGNTHYLNRGPDSPGVSWASGQRGVVLGYVRVPAGQTAYLTHTDEHGCNGIGEGTYRIGRQRERAEEIRMIAD